MGRQNFSNQRGRGRGGRGRGGNDGGRGRRGTTANFRGPGYNDGIAKSADEKTVGILRYLSPETTGFCGTIKERYSDFVVREVALNGEVVYLTDVTRKEDLKKELKISEIVKKRVLAYLEDKAVESATPLTHNGEFQVNNRVRGLVGRLAGKMLGLFNHNKRLAASTGDRANIMVLQKVVANVCGEDTAQGLTEFLTKLLDARVTEQSNSRMTSSVADESFLFPVILDKERRMTIHQNIRNLCSTLVISDSAPNADGVSVIRVRRIYGSDGKKRKDMDNRSNRVQWPTDRPDFLQFVLFKKNMETMSVISQLARAMAVQPSSFTYSGTKDKRGITTQLITVYRGSIDRLAALNKARRNLDEFNFIVGNATYVTDRLNLGDLRGNQFTMAIRNLPPTSVLSDQVIDDAVATWARRGFINYFGLQRFGTRSIATHEVGRAILQRNHKLVIDLIMSPQDGDASKITEARQHFMDTKDIDQAIQSFPPYFIAEHSILQGLKTHGLMAHTNAIACIPRHLRMMYTHAYQSYVWNVLASERLEHFSSTDVILGDLVLPHDVVDSSIEEVVNDDDEGNNIVDENVEVQESQVGTETTPAPTKKRKLASKARVDVVVITESNRSLYSIYDVVLPLPGYDITLPQNALKERYEATLAKDGIDFSLLSRATNSEYHLPGSYRPLLRKPLRVSHEIKEYDDPTLNLVQSDVDHLLGIKPQPSIVNGKYRALCLEFQLSPSSYATMAVRELMKQSSNINAQTQIQDQNNSKI